MMQIDRNRYKEVPEHMISTIEAYVNKGVHTGGFLKAILSNDLVESSGLADDTNIYILHIYAKILYCELPRNSWGSPDAYNNWIESFKEGDEYDKVSENEALTA